MAKINIVEDEHAVLFTGYNKEEVRRLGVDARNCAVLDSACSSTVCGDSCIYNYFQSLDKDDRLYGLKDGARQFYLSVKDELLRLGCKMSELDPAMFFLHNSGKLSVTICYNVDDFLHAGGEHLENIMVNLRKRFVAGKVEERNFYYIGFRIKQESSALVLDQYRYVENVKNKVTDPNRAQDKQSTLTAEEQTEYRQLIGQIN